MIKIIFVGKTKDSSILSMQEHYLKMIKPLSKLKILHIPKSKLSQKRGINEILEDEGKRVVENFSKDDFIVSLDRRGTQKTTKELAAQIKATFNQSRHPAFVVGSGFGLAKGVLRQSDLVLSFSQLTFTHNLIRPFLFEQLYRVLTIIYNKKYHY